MAEPLKRCEVVTAFLRYNDRILLLRRSADVGTYKGRWAGVSGYLETRSPLTQAWREIKEETGLTKRQAHLVCEGAPIEVPAPEHNTCWVVHPFLFDIDDPTDITLDREHEEQTWILPAEILGYSTVPSLVKALAVCLERERSGVLN